jgi:hypothetical protein
MTGSTPPIRPLTKLPIGTRADLGRANYNINVVMMQKPFADFAVDAPDTNDLKLFMQKKQKKKRKIKEYSKTTQQSVLKKSIIIYNTETKNIVAKEKRNVREIPEVI